MIIKLNYKSVNSISQYFKSLERKGYLIRNNFNKLVINGNITSNYNLKKIKIINTKNESIEISLNKRKNYIGYRINNNCFKNINILKNDILIIEINKKLNTNDLGLFIIDNKYRIMKYDYKDGFYILKDNETILLNHVKAIGKVKKLIRSI